MIKKEMKEIDVYYCDNCSSKLIEEPDVDEIEEYEDIKGNTVHLCYTCLDKLSTCECCKRVDLTGENLFRDYDINDGELLCNDCLEEELPRLEKALSAAKRFIDRHRVE